jgi:hypothetical protein
MGRIIQPKGIRGSLKWIQEIEKTETLFSFAVTMN